MSDHFVRFIPEEINITLCKNSMRTIEKLNWGGNIPRFIFNEQVQFADAGQNFESVKCPLCKVDLMEWWREAMNSAFSDEHGFVNIEITTPCCSMEMTLHNLEYTFPQGFYKVMIEVMSDNEFAAEKIMDDLLKITEVKWRLVNTHY